MNSSQQQGSGQQNQQGQQNQNQQQLPPNTWIVGNRMFSTCPICGKTVCVTKRGLGDLHWCKR